ncbi:MAG TPA: ABC transporter permease [Mycobacteriales bacterium]|nr:ABC transporter permease [Mycobacteriales bacterium]
MTAPSRSRGRGWSRRLVALGVEAVLPVVLVVVWYLTSAGSTNFYFPPLSRILRAFADSWFGSRFTADVLPSLGRAGAGFGLAVVCGVAVGLLLGSSRVARSLFEPLVEFARAVPPPVLVPVAVLAFGLGNSMRISVIVAGSVWPVLLNTVEGVRGLDEVLRDTASAYRITGWRRIWRVILPAASPPIMAGVRTCLALSLILMVISEMVGGGNGIGFFVQQSQRSFALPEMWAGILLLGLVGYLAHLVFSAVERRLLSWHSGSRQSSRGES